MSPAQLGENIITPGILLNLPKDTILAIGSTARIQDIGLRNPYKQMDSIEQESMSAVLGRDEHGNLIKEAGIVGVIREGKEVKAGDNVAITLLTEPFVKIENI